MSVTEEQLSEISASRRGSIKPWLMDQHSLAGLGNVYSDEILFQAKIHPRYPVSDLGNVLLEDLYYALKSVLRTAIDAHADPDQLPAYYLLPHRHKDGHCPRCHTAVQPVTVGGRTGWYCPKYQNH